MKRISLLLLPLVVFLSCAVYAQKASDAVPRPKLVVGIVIDQMRWDYLYRYYDRYQAGGFKRLLNEGFSCQNTFITHLPAHTAVGHSTIFTGSVPAIHGIVGNNWTDQLTWKNWYCTEDTVEKTVGSTSVAGQMSPRNLLASTVTDELALATNFRAKIIGVSLKDRAAILPAGHTPTGAFWMDDDSGNFITSTFYMKDLPDWVKQFNARKEIAKMISKPWTTLYPVNTYVQSTPDNVAWEGKFPGEKQPVFPHDIAVAYNKDHVNFRRTPYGNTLTLEFAKAAVDGYDLANGPATNFLTINCASTDYVGHFYGPNSIEVEDTYLRLDRDLADFFSYLDKKAGKGNYTVFLTADHGAAHSIPFMQAHNLPSDFLKSKTVVKDLNTYLAGKYNVQNIIKGSSSAYISFDVDKIAKAGLSYDAVKQVSVEFLRRQPGIQFAADMNKIGDTSVPVVIREKLINGYNSKRCGDVGFVPQPGWFDGGKTGTSHGQWNPFDTHIPLVFMGWGIRHGASVNTYSMTDIAPTIAALLHIQMPSGCIGKAIGEVMAGPAK
ncbi:alkaline phosphatase family protein [Pedobacter sp. BS3]|uniref:alkaline phosphatase PafA n=1 Tax=Pedobacter sp. BS3 TaxID=2567937 RepID=UPI0011ECE1C6|nr:alkaline phosphatase PafA [Pedobacter sp. BS3]TZF83189.1 alkaline phosphatase family protein [Pedobacter sp. BS3]